MTSPYQDLIQRVESGEVSPNIDLAILDISGIKPDRSHLAYPAYAFLDDLNAAAMLVPEGWDWFVGNCGGEASASVNPSEQPFPVELDITADAPTPAAALVSACLRAKQALIEEERG